MKYKIKRKDDLVNLLHSRLYFRLRDRLENKLPWKLWEVLNDRLYFRLRDRLDTQMGNVLEERLEYEV